MDFDTLQKVQFAWLFIPMVLFWALTILIHVLFAAAVARDAGALRDNGQRIILVGPMIWVFATLIGGVFVGVTFWLMHHTEIFQDKAPADY
jgi:hypothetical protein